MQGEATTATTEARSLRLTRPHEAAPGRSALGAGQSPRGLSTVDDARLREAVRALLAAIDALP